MHIDRTHQISVPAELAFAAFPISPFVFVFVLTCRTLARCSSFGAGEAHDVSRLAFVSQVINVFAIFPQGHALIVVPAAVLLANTMRIADEEGLYLFVNAEVDHLTGGFVPQVTNTPLQTFALFVFGMLHLCCLHLSRFTALELFIRQVIQLVDLYRVHGYNLTLNERSLQVEKTR
jgi:hypothetical protein